MEGTMGSIDIFWQNAVEELSGPFLISDDSVLVPAELAERFVHWAVQTKRILGFEGFLYDGRTLVPLMEAIADFSRTKQADKNEELSTALLKEKEFQKAQFFEFVLE